MSGKPWFRPKAFGFGVVPTTWAGWAVVAAYVAALIGLERYLRLDGRPGPTRLAVFFVLAIVATGLMLWVSWLKTEGGLRWRWGGRKDQ